MMRHVLTASISMMLLVFACGETEEIIPTSTPEGTESRPDPNLTTSATAEPGTSFHNPVPLNQSHTVGGWEITVYGHEAAQWFTLENVTYATDPGLLLVMVQMKVRNVSAGEPADVDSLGLVLADAEGRAFGLHAGAIEERIPSLLGYPTTLLQPGGELEGGLIFQASASSTDWRLLAGQETYFATK